MKTTYYIEILKNKVKNRFSPETISIVSCSNLSKQIFESTQSLISASTLQRVFDLIDSKSKPSLSTLNILSDYTGFDNWDNFKKHQETPNTNISQKYIPDEMAITLLGICLKNHDFKTALEYLDKLSPYDEHAKTITAPVFRKALRTDIKARKVLIHELTKSRNRRILTVERNIDLKHLNTYYHDVIIESKKIIEHSDKTMFNSDISFYNSILFLHSLNNNNKRNSLKYAYELISKVKPEEAYADNFYYMFPLVRYHTTYLMYLKLSKKITDKDTISTIERMETIILNSDNNDDLILFTISEMFRSLTFCERYEDVIFLYNKYKKQSVILNVDDNYYQLIIKMVDKSYLEVANNGLSII